LLGRVEGGTYTVPHVAFVKPQGTQGMFHRLLVLVYVYAILVDSSFSEKASVVVSISPIVPQRFLAYIEVNAT